MFERLWKKILRRRRFSLWTLAAFILWLVSLVYRAAFAMKRRSTEGIVKTGVPLISVGNITVGGSGKTTTVELLARFLLDEGVRVGIVSSGYGRSDQDSIVEPGYRIQKLDSRVTGDEVRHLADLLPEAHFSIDRSKSQAAVRLGETGQVDVIIVDDGFQHSSLHRDLDIVTFDAAVPRRYMKAFPLGILREPRSALTRADIILITRANLSEDPGELQKQIKQQCPQADVYRAQFVHTELMGRDRRLPVKYLEDKSVLLFAGIGNFRPLVRQVTALCCDLDQAIELSDHQRYDHQLLKQIKAAAERHDSDVILTTGKDWVKLGDFAFGREIYYLAQTIDLDPGEEKLVRDIMQKLHLRRCSS